MRRSVLLAARSSAKGHRPNPLAYRPSIKAKPSESPPLDAPSSSPARRGPWLVSGLAVFSFTVYGTYLYQSYNHSVAYSKTLSIPEDVSDRYNKTAEHYDSDVDTMEWFMGLGKKRQQLLSKATGDVLEVCVGTGRNLQYYPSPKLRSITLVDTSQPMLDMARDKVKSMPAPKRQAQFIRVDSSGGLSTSQTKYDTVVQTFGLCSVARPVEHLQDLGAVCKSDGGQMLLLEHGRSHYDWLNKILDNIAAAHADRHGCWWNRDIGKIVEHSGLEIVSIKRYHAGTTWCVELRPRKEAK